MGFHAKSRSRCAVVGMVFALAGWLACGTAAADVFYVDDAAPLGGDGGDWSTAFTYLQDALTVATSGDEIWVAGGIYTPDLAESGGITPGDRHASFHLASGLEIFGGYAGSANSGAPDTRNMVLYETVLSGDLSGNDDPNNVFTNRTDNSYHVVIASDTDATALLDGVTISGGFGVARDGEPAGGGIYMVNGSATFMGCTIRQNATFSGYGFGETGLDTGDGAGVFCQGGAPTFTDCTVSDNAAGAGYNAFFVSSAGEGGSGGGLCFVGAEPVVSGCRLLRNRAGNGGTGDWGGGGARAGGSGGAVYLIDCPLAEFLDCTMISNRAGVGGAGLGYGGPPGAAGGNGGAVAAKNSGLSVTHCAFSDNQSGVGGVGADGSPQSTAGGPGGNGGGGGALYAYNTTTGLLNSSFTANCGGAGGAGGGATYGHGGTGGRGGDGGALYLQDGEVSIRNCRLTANVTGGGGSGGNAIYDLGGNGGKAGDSAGVVATGTQTTVILADCVVADNTTGNGGNAGSGPLGLGVGGAAGRSAGVRSASQLTLRNCTIAYNAVGTPGTPNGTAALTGGVELLTDCVAAVYNTIVWGNTGAAPSVETQQIAGVPPSVDYCDVEGWTGGLGGVGNFGTNPLFVDAGNADYHLAAGSPCINTGDPGFVPLPDEQDIDGQPRVLDGLVDTGADEFAPPLPGDLNCDGEVDFGDINPFVLALSNPSAWHAAYPGCPPLNGDVSDDGLVDFGDINPFVMLLSGSGLN